MLATLAHPSLNVIPRPPRIFTSDKAVRPIGLEDVAALSLKCSNFFIEHDGRPNVWHDSQQVKINFGKDELVVAFFDRLSRTLIA